MILVKSGNPSVAITFATKAMANAPPKGFRCLRISSFLSGFLCLTSAALPAESFYLKIEGVDSSELGQDSAYLTCPANPVGKTLSWAKANCRSTKAAPSGARIQMLKTKGRILVEDR